MGDGEPVEAKMSIKLVQHTPEPEKLIAAAARLCYSRSGAEKIMEGLEPSQVSSFLNMLLEMGHESPIEHISFTFTAEGVSRALTHQLVRHRIGCSYSQQSQRYVRLDQFAYIIPPAIDQVPQAREKFINIMEQIQNTYNELSELLIERHYRAFLEEGYSHRQARHKAEKQAIEDARYVFPNACETKIMFTMNARALFNFFNQRCCNRAQWEIRNMAIEMLRLVRQVAPNLFRFAGPSCLTGPCPEGKMSCGKVEEVREKFKQLA